MKGEEKSQGTVLYAAILFMGSSDISSDTGIRSLLGGECSTGSTSPKEWASALRGGPCC